MELDILKQNTTWNDASASINNNFAKVKTAIEQGVGGGSVAVDTQMSDTSENAVSNKVIKKYVDDEVEDAKAHSEEMADNAENAAKEYADNNKVAKVDGKQLSTEDFTTALKQKLDGLTNYDDADVRSAITELQNDLDAIVNGDATSAINSIQEILAFLSTITDTQTLAGIVADLKKYVDQRAQQAYDQALEYTEEEISALGNSLREYTDNKVESVSPLYVNIGMDFPNETATGTLPDLEISFSDILSAAEGKRDIWIVVSDGTAYQCLVTYLSENSGGIVIRAYKHEVNGANFSTIAIAFVDGSVPIWHSNYIEFQEKLVSGENLATINGRSLLEGGNIVVEGGGGGASIPVVSYEEELESLSQNKGDLAVILSDDEVKNGKVRCLDLPSISMTAVQAYDFSECASVQGIAINTEVDVPPCPAFAGQNIQFMIVPRKMNSPATATFLGFDLSEDLDADGYLRGALQVTSIENGSSSSAAPFAQYDEATGKMVADEVLLATLNAAFSMIEDPVFVSMSEMLAAGGDGLKDTLAFFECIASVASFGTKSIRIKNDEGYSRLDSDVIRTIPKDAVANISKLKMPNASQVRVYCPDETVYDTHPKDFKCCITEPSIYTSNATIVSKIEFIKTCDTTISSASNPLPPYIILCNQSLNKKLSIRWVAGETAPYKAMYSEDEWATSVILLENGVWNEENLEALDAIIASGVNILFELGKNNENGSGDDVNIYNPKTGVMTYLEDYGDDGILTEEELATISLLVDILFGSYFTIFANERVIPEHIESYSRMEGKWVKDEEEVETEWSESSPTSNKPIATSLFVALMRDYDDDIRKELDSKQPKLVSGENIATVNGKSLLEGGNIVIEGGEGGGSNITVDSALSTTSTNPVQNAVITAELNKKVNAESGKGLSTNDYTTAEKNKLASIAANAEVNVQSDWNATSGDAFIKNKPTFATINGQRIDQGGEINIEAGESITVDSALSSTSENAIQNKVVTEALDRKQPRLVSGSNIMTINGQSILGHGDLVIGGDEGAQVVLFDATCAQYPYDLPELTTTTDVQSITDAIALSQPICIQFAAALCPATEASLVNGYPHLFLHLADAEDGIARMIHIYADDVVWTWETFEMELGGASGDYVRSVNGVTPDDNGNVQIEVNIDGEVVDTTLSSLVGSGSTFTLEELVG